jgi:hypothetical protein
MALHRLLDKRVQTVERCRRREWVVSGPKDIGLEPKYLRKLFETLAFLRAIKALLPRRHRGRADAESLGDFYAGQHPHLHRGRNERPKARIRSFFFVGS